MSDKPSILVTSAAGEVGSIGRSIVKGLLALGFPVRGFVRSDDGRAQSLREMGAEVYVGDLLNPRDVSRALVGCDRVYFSMSLNPSYADATIIMAAAIEARGGVELLCNMSDFEQSYMTLDTMSGPDAERVAILGADVQWSPQQRVHWAAERALEWSGLPVANIQAAMFVENPITLWVPAVTIAQDDTLRLPFGSGKTAPVATADVAAVCVKVLAEGGLHAGRAYRLTGPVRKDWHAFAEDFSAVAGRRVTYVPVPTEEFRSMLKRLNPHMPEHILAHLTNLAVQNAGGRYVAEVTDDVRLLLGRPATSFRTVLEVEAWRFAPGAAPNFKHRDVAGAERSPAP